MSDRAKDWCDAVCLAALLVCVIVLAWAWLKFTPNQLSAEAEWLKADAEQEGGV